MAIALSEITQDFGSVTNSPNIWYYNGSTYTKVTNLTTFDYFSDTATVGDIIYFFVGFANSDFAPHKISLNVGTALAATSITVAWEYAYMPTETQDIAKFTTDFKALSVTDTSNTFQNTGAQTITWAIPNDWSIFNANSVFGVNQRYNVVRCRITAVSGLTEGGANSTTIAKNAHNRITVDSGSESGTATGGGTSYLQNSAAPWTANELVGRHIWITSGTNAGKCFPIRENSTSTIQFGTPRSYALGLQYNYTSPETGIISGDKYVISYNMEDIYQADVSGGWGLITTDENVRHPMRIDTWLYKITAAEIYLSGSSGSEAFVGGYNQCWYFHPSCTIEMNSSTYCKFAFGMRGQEFDNSGNPTKLSNFTAYGLKLFWDNYSYENTSPSFAGWIYDTTFINGRTYSFVNTLNLDNVDVYNVTTTNMQLGVLSNTTGLNLTQWMAEPLRNVSSTFGIKGYKAGNQACHYSTSPGDYLLDSPAGGKLQGGSYISFSNWSAHTSGDTTCIDLDADSPQKVYFTVGAAGTERYLFKFRVRLTVVDELNNPVVGASITVENKNASVEFTDTTIADGTATNNGDNMVLANIHTQPVSSGLGDEDPQNPFTITIRKAGYETYKSTVTITKALEEIITLKPRRYPRR